MNIATIRHAYEAYRALPDMVDEYQALDRKFRLEFKKDEKDIYLLNIYFAHLLLLIDSLKDEHSRLLELVLGGE